MLYAKGSVCGRLGIRGVLHDDINVRLCKMFLVDRAISTLVSTILFIAPCALPSNRTLRIKPALIIPTTRFASQKTSGFILLVSLLLM